MSQINAGRARGIRVALPLGRSGFGPGTGILTAEGELPVEFLEPGDRIVTRDRGLVALARVIARQVPACEVLRVHPAVLDPANAAAPFLISAQQQLVLTDWRARVMHGQRAALITANMLVDGEHIARIDDTAPVRLFQIVFDDARHVIPLAGGTLLAASPKVPQMSLA